MTRRVLAGVGALVAAYGAWLLLSRQDLDQLVNAALWLGGGVVLHDLVLAPVVIAVVAGLARLPDTLRTPAVVAFVVLGSVTLLAVPVLGRFGALPDNPTLLDRNYLLGWSILMGLALVGVALATVARSRRSDSPGKDVDGAGPGR